MRSRRERMNRRQFFAAGLSCVAGGLAHGQEIIVESSPDTRPVEGEEELWFLLSALYTLIFVMTGGVLKEPNEIARTIQDFQPYGAQFGEANAVEIFDGALISNEGRVRVQDGLPIIAETLVGHYIIRSTPGYDLQIVLPSFHSVTRALVGEYSMVVQLLWAEGD